MAFWYATNLQYKTPFDNKYDGNFATFQWLYILKKELIDQLSFETCLK